MLGTGVGAGVGVGIGDAMAEGGSECAPSASALICVQPVAKRMAAQATPAIFTTLYLRLNISGLKGMVVFLPVS
jgi:hypothetical protein